MKRRIALTAMGWVLLLLLSVGQRLGFLQLQTVLGTNYGWVMSLAQLLLVLLMAFWNRELLIPGAEALLHRKADWRIPAVLAAELSILTGVVIMAAEIITAEPTLADHLFFALAGSAILASLLLAFVKQTALTHADSEVSSALHRRACAHTPDWKNSQFLSRGARLDRVLTVVSLLSSVAALGISLSSGAAVLSALLCASAVLAVSSCSMAAFASDLMLRTGFCQAVDAGVLFRSCDCMTELHTAQTILIEKNGVLTAGDPVVTDVLAYGGEPSQLLQLAASMEQESEHPIGVSIVRTALAQGLGLLEPERLLERHSKGIEATIGGKCCYAGTLSFLRSCGVQAVRADQFALQGKTPVYIGAEGGVCLGVIALLDPVLPSAADLVHALVRQKLHPVMMTGDHALASRSLADKLGITEVIAESLPDEKCRRIRAMRNSGKRVAMLGDGRKLEQEFAVADFAISTVSGSPTGGAELLEDVPMSALQAFQSSRQLCRASKLIRFFAVGYHAIFLPLAYVAASSAAAAAWTPFLCAALPLCAIASVRLLVRRLLCSADPVIPDEATVETGQEPPKPQMTTAEDELQTIQNEEINSEDLQHADTEPEG